MIKHLKRAYVYTATRMDLYYELTDSRIEVTDLLIYLGNVGLEQQEAIDHGPGMLEPTAILKYYSDYKDGYPCKEIARWYKNLQGCQNLFRLNRYLRDDIDLGEKLGFTQLDKYKSCIQTQFDMLLLQK